MPMEIMQLRCFLAVAEELHFGRAAERLHIAQPALSRIIQHFERDVGTQLFERTTRRVRLTRAGDALMISAREIVEGCRSAEIAVRAAGRGQTGRVRIAFAGPSSHGLVAALARQVRHDCPGIELAFVSSLYGLDAVGQLLDGAIDLAIVRWRTEPPKVGWRAIQREEYVIVTPIDHPLAARRKVAMAELRDESFVTLPKDPGSDMHAKFLELCHQAGFAPTVTQVAPDSWTVMTLVAAGVGITFSVDSAARQVPTDGLHTLKIADAREPVFARLAWRREGRSPAVDAVLRASRKALPTARW